MSATAVSDLADPFAAARGWTLTWHVQEQAEKRGFHVQDIFDAAEYPELVVPHKSDQWKESRTRGDVRVVVNPFEKCIITVYDSHRANGTDQHWEKRMARQRAEQAERAAKTEQEDQRAAAVREAEATRKALRPLQERLARGRQPSTGTTCLPAAAAAPAPSAEAPAPVAPAAARVMSRLERDIRAIVLPQLQQRPGVWAVLETNVPGLVNVLSKCPEIKVDVVDGQFMACWAV